MKTKDIKKLLLLIALTILLVGLVCAATTNKTTDNKDTKILKETQKSPSNTKVKTTGIKTIDKKTNTSKENKAKTKKSQSKTYTTTASSFKELYNKVEDAKDYKYENYASYTINLKKGDYISTKELEWNNIIWKNTKTIQKLTINGNGATINGQNKHRFITVYEKSTLTLNNLQLTNFKSDYGGAIKNNGNLIIQNSNLKNNKATNVGGAIYTFKNKITITKTKLDNNIAANDGGSIYSYKGTITIKNSILNNHEAKYGGAIYNTGYTKIYDSTLNNNKAKINGGAIYNQDSKLTITNTKLNTNKAVDGGAIENYNGTISITKSTLNKNKVTGNGGAVDNYAGILKLKYSILNNNQAKYGGAVYLDQITKKNIIKNNIFKSNKAKGKSGTIYDNTNTKKVVLSNNNIIDDEKTNTNNNPDTSTTKKVKLTITTSSNLKTDGELRITVKALNGTKRLDDGKIRIKFNDKKITNEWIYNSKLTTYYNLPNKAGKYTITAEYLKNNKILATKNKNIKITDSEKITFQTKQTSKTNTKHTYLVKVTNADGEANKGTVRIKLNGKVIADKNVKNGIVRIEYKMPQKAGTYKATAQYIKYEKVIKTLNKNIKVKDSETMSFTTKTVEGNNNYAFEVKVKNPEGNVNYGKVRIKLNGKVITNTNVKNGIVKITYKLPNQTKTYKVTAEYIKNGKITKTVSKNINIKYNPYPILTKTVTFNDGTRYENIGAGDCASSFIEWKNAQYDKGAYVVLWYNGKNGGEMYPHTYRLTKATFYHENYYTGQIIQDTVTPGCYYITDKYTTVKSRLRDYYKPYKVQIYYRKMTPNEKNILRKYA